MVTSSRFGLSRVILVLMVDMLILYFLLVILWCRIVMSSVVEL